MKIYHYHPDTLVYVGCDNADESPLEPGVFHIPAHATKIEPPETVQDSSVVRFVGGAWVVEEIVVPPEEVQAVPTPEELIERQNADVKRAIASLEFSQGRAIREAVLTGDMSRLKAIDDQIIELRAQFQ